MTLRKSIGVLTLVGALALTDPALAGPPFRTDDPEPVDFQHFELTLFSTGTKTQDGWTNALPAFEINYGAAPNLQLHLIMPLGYTAPTDGRSGFGLGDLELGAKYRFITPGEDDWYPQVAIFPLVEVPIGNQNMGFSTGHAQIFLPIWLQKEFGDWTVYGGGGYWINPGFGQKNWWFEGVALWRKINDQLNVGVEVFHQGSSTDGQPESTGFNAGLIYDFTEHWHLLASAGTGMQNRARTNQFSYYTGLQLTF
jgi:hypothetical protein